jgi:hypothetical protein
MSFEKMYLNVQTKGHFFLNTLGLQGYASPGWLTAFRQLHGIREITMQGEKFEIAMQGEKYSCDQAAIEFHSGFQDLIVRDSWNIFIVLMKQDCFRNVFQ